MASPSQSPFGLYVTLASVAFSLVAFTTVASNSDGILNSSSRKDRRKKTSQTRPQPTRRAAGDGLLVDTTETPQASDPPVAAQEIASDSHDDQAEMRAVQDQQDETAAVISQTAKLSRSLRTRPASGSEKTAVAEVQNELSMITGRLCRLQQELITDPDAVNLKEGFGTSFQSSIQAIQQTYTALEEDLRGEELSPTALDSAKQRLQQHRPLLESLFIPTDSIRLPPTPPSGAVPDPAPNGHSSVDVTPQPSPRISFDTGVTPSATRVEPPVEYLPPVESSTVADDAPEEAAEEVAEENPAEEMAAPATRTETSETTTAATPDKDDTPATNDALYTAVTDNDGDSLSKLLSRGLDPMAQFGELQRTALHQAAHLNRVDCLQTLLHHGAALRTEDAKGDTALHLAAWVGNVEALALLLEHGAEVDWLSGRDGYSALWCAVSAHHTAAARLLLKHGAQVGLRASGAGGGLTPLHQAAVTGQGAMCELLLAHGAPVAALDDDRSAPLHYAAVSGAVPAVTALLRRGADIEARQLHGLTAVHWAAHKGHVDALAALLDYGARLDPRAGEGGATPLHLAASRGHTAAALLLVERGAKSRPVRASWAGVAGTPADMAKAKKHSELARMLRV